MSKNPDTGVLESKPPSKARRLFIGLSPRSPLPAELVSFISQLQDIFPNRMRWHNPDELHLTLLFLGNLPISDCEKLFSHFKRERFLGLSQVFDRLGHFHQKVLYLGTTQASSALISIHEEIFQKYSDYQIKKEAKKFTPHFTLGRNKDSSDLESSISNLSVKTPRMSLELEAPQIFESLPGNSPRYVPLH